MRESREVRYPVDDCRVARLLKSDYVRVCRLDHLGDLLGAADAAFANVVGEEAHLCRSGCLAVHFSRFGLGGSLVDFRFLHEDEVRLVHHHIPHRLYE